MISTEEQVGTMIRRRAERLRKENPNLLDKYTDKQIFNAWFYVGDGDARKIPLVIEGPEP